MLDLLIVITYFIIIFLLALRGRTDKHATVEKYFLSDRSLTWPSIAISSIATNINGYQFLGMMGSAYLYGLAQASLEINAIQGILLAAFIFVPLFLQARVITVTQYIQQKLGKTVGLVYSLANLFLFSTITLGAALFWGAYAADLVFSDYLSFIHSDRLIRIGILLAGLGIFSAIYTYMGGLNAVVKTDILQFCILLLGGCIVLYVTVKAIGGWSILYTEAPEKMHLYLPKDHPKLPWTHLFGLFFLNINYWCANQTIMQRSLAARSLRHAQIGLMVGGIMKYIMAILIVIPGIALFIILGKEGLTDPDMAYPYIVKNYLPVGVKGIILCALFASLMSTVDSTFNSLSTLWSIDIYRGYIRKDATDAQTIAAGKRAILFALTTGITMGLILLYIKFNDPGAAFTHTLNELRYYINCGIAAIIIVAALTIAPKKKIILAGFLSTIPLHLLLQYFFPDMNYFVRAGWVISVALLGMLLLGSGGQFRSLKDIFHAHDKQVRWMGIVLAISLVMVHIIFR